MARRVRPMTGDLVDGLPGDCARCLFWEQAGACPDPRATPLLAGRRPPGGPPSDPTIRKQAWASARVQEGTQAGRVVVVDDEVVAYSLAAPVEAFAARGPLVPTPREDALLLATLWVHPLHRGSGIGRLLVHAALKEAIRLDLAAVEAFGDRRWHERNCVLPATWLLHEGFEVCAEHPRTPLLRLDVRRTVRWVDSLEQAWEEVLGRLPRRVLTPSSEPVAGAVPLRDLARRDAPEP